MMIAKYNELPVVCIWYPAAESTILIPNNAVESIDPIKTIRGVNRRGNNIPK